HAFGLPVERGRAAERPVRGGVQELLIRQRSPQEEGQARREIDVSQSRPGVRGLRRLLETKHEAWIREDALNAEPNAFLEIAALSPCLRVELEEIVEVVLDRTAVRLRCKTPENVGRAGA